MYRHISVTCFTTTGCVPVLVTDNLDLCSNVRYYSKLHQCYWKKSFVLIAF